MAARPSAKRRLRWLGWTNADQAELDCVLWEFLSRREEHRARCPRCQAERETGWPCPYVREAWEAVEDWIARRRLLSRAEWFRRRHLLERLDELQQREAS
jgi:hypothetical protein